LLLLLLLLLLLSSLLLVFVVVVAGVGILLVDLIILVAVVMFCVVLKGVYLEIGGGNGWHASNTLFFEQHLNWTGFLIEPTPCAKCMLPITRPRDVILNAGACEQPTVLCVALISTGGCVLHCTGCVHAGVIYMAVVDTAVSLNAVLFLDMGNSCDDDFRCFRDPCLSKTRASVHRRKTTASLATTLRSMYEHPFILLSSNNAHHFYS
jgi:hypothetical protein